MIKYFLLIWLAFSINLFADEKDSAALEKRIEKAIEWIKKDSLFNAYMVANCPKDLTFFLKDSTIYPIMFNRIVSGLFPDSSSKFKSKIWNLSKECEKNWNGPRFISPQLNNKNSNYRLILIEFSLIPFMLGFYVTDNNHCLENRGIITYILYDLNSDIYHSYSIKNDIFSHPAPK